MNSQFKKGVLELCVLSMVAAGDTYGYELIDRISKKFSIAVGTIYPLLRRMTNEGYFHTYHQESPGGPSRKYYRLSAKGETALRGMHDGWCEFRDAVDEILEGSSI